MLKLTRILLLAVLATLGLAACSSASGDGAAISNPAALGLPAGRPAFLISYADW